MNRDVIPGNDIEIHIAEGQIRIVVAQGSGQLGTLILDPQAICWESKHRIGETPSVDDKSWIILWEQFATMMESADLGKVLRPNNAKYISVERAGQKIVRAKPELNTPMPEMRERLPISRQLNAVEMALLRKGFIFQHWLGTFDGQMSEFRIYRGPCMYALRFRVHKDGCEIDAAWVNREMLRDTDLRKHVEIVSWFIDVQVLGQEREFPRF